MEIGVFSTIPDESDCGSGLGAASGASNAARRLRLTASYSTSPKRKVRASPNPDKFHPYRALVVEHEKGSFAFAEFSP